MPDFADYEQVEMIAAGRSRVVYRARHPVFGAVALKAYPAHLTSRPEIRAALEMEHALQSEVGSIAPRPLEINIAGGCLYLAESWVEGAPFGFEADVSRARTIATGLCRALADVHRADILHNDLKPSNVVITVAGVRLLDFGAACRSPPHRGDPAPLQHSTAGYAAPELFGGGPPSPRSDIFSLGCTLVELFSGRPVFALASQFTYWGMLANLREVGPRSLVGTPPEPIPSILVGCLEFDPSKRPGRAEDVAEAIMGTQFS